MFFFFFFLTVCVFGSYFRTLAMYFISDSFVEEGEEEGEERERDKQTDRQTDRQRFCSLSKYNNRDTMLNSNTRVFLFPNLSELIKRKTGKSMQLKEKILSEKTNQGIELIHGFV